MARPWHGVSVKILVKGLQDESEVTRAEVACELGLRGSEAAQAVENLILAAAHDDEACVRGSAITALERLARDEVEVLQPLERHERAASFPASARLAFCRERVEMAT